MSGNGSVPTGDGNELKEAFVQDETTVLASAGDDVGEGDTLTKRQIITALSKAGLGAVGIGFTPIAAFRQGLKIGHGEGATEGFARGLAKGESDGFARGIEQGREEGKREAEDSISVILAEQHEEDAIIFRRAMNLVHGMDYGRPGTTREDGARREAVVAALNGMVPPKAVEAGAFFKLESNGLVSFVGSFDMFDLVVRQHSPETMTLLGRERAQIIGAISDLRWKRDKNSGLFAIENKVYLNTLKPNFIAGQLLPFGRDFLTNSQWKPPIPSDTKIGDYDLPFNLMADVTQLVYLREAYSMQGADFKKAHALIDDVIKLHADNVAQQRGAEPLRHTMTLGDVPSVTKFTDILEECGIHLGSGQDEVEIRFDLKSNQYYLSVSLAPDSWKILENTFQGVFTEQNRRQHEESLSALSSPESRELIESVPKDRFLQRAPALTQRAMPGKAAALLAESDPVLKRFFSPCNQHKVAVEQSAAGLAA